MAGISDTERANIAEGALDATTVHAEIIEKALAVVRLLRDTEGLVEHLSFDEAETLAELAKVVGQTGRAQALMQDWARLDEEAVTFEEELMRWGVRASWGNPDGAGPDGLLWKIKGEVEF